MYPSSFVAVSQTGSVDPRKLCEQRKSGPLPRTVRIELNNPRRVRYQVYLVRSPLQSRCLLTLSLTSLLHSALYAFLFPPLHPLRFALHLRAYKHNHHNSLRFIPSCPLLLFIRVYVSHSSRFFTHPMKRLAHALSFSRSHRVLTLAC